MIHLRKTARVVKFLEIESRTVVDRYWKEWGKGELLFDGYRVCFAI